MAAGIAYLMNNLGGVEANVAAIIALGLNEDVLLGHVL